MSQRTKGTPIRDLLMHRQRTPAAASRRQELSRDEAVALLDSLQSGHVCCSISCWDICSNCYTQVDFEYALETIQRVLNGLPAVDETRLHLPTKLIHQQPSHA